MKKRAMNGNAMFLTSNQDKIVRLVTDFHDLNHVAGFRYVLYCDSDSWEIFDPTFGVTVVKHEFKHLSSVISDIWHLKQAIIEVGMIKHNGLRKQSAHQTYCLKYLSKIYPNHINYWLYGKL